MPARVVMRNAVSLSHLRECEHVSIMNISLLSHRFTTVQFSTATGWDAQLLLLSNYLYPLRGTAIISTSLVSTFNNRLHLKNNGDV